MGVGLRDFMTDAVRFEMVINLGTVIHLILLCGFMGLLSLRLRRQMRRDLEKIIKQAPNE